MYRIDMTGDINRKLEEKFVKMVGRDTDSSGTDLVCGLRDLSWTFRTKQRALDVFDKLCRQKDIEVRLTRET